MQLAHNTLVVVADGRKALFLRNEGDATDPNLIVEHAEERRQSGRPRPENAMRRAAPRAVIGGRAEHDGRSRFPPAGRGSLRRRCRRDAQEPRARQRIRNADHRRAGARRSASSANIIMSRSKTDWPAKSRRISPAILCPKSRRRCPPLRRQSYVARLVLASRLRATSAAAAPPNRKIIGGAGTGAGGPPDEPVDPLLPCQPPFDDQPPLDPQPLDDEP